MFRDDLYYNRSTTDESFEENSLSTKSRQGKKSQLNPNTEPYTLYGPIPVDINKGFTAPIEIIMVADFICPWCYIGKKLIHKK
jgi:hypothetical protein